MTQVATVYVPYNAVGVNDNLGMNTVIATMSWKILFLWFFFRSIYCAYCEGYFLPDPFYCLPFIDCWPWNIMNFWWNVVPHFHCLVAPVRPCWQTASTSFTRSLEYILTYKRTFATSTNISQLFRDILPYQLWHGIWRHFVHYMYIKQKNSGQCN